MIIQSVQQSEVDQIVNECEKLMRKNKLILNNYVHKGR